MNKQVTRNQLLIMLFITLCCVVARGDEYRADLTWPGWEHDIQFYMTGRASGENYSMATLHDAFDAFNETLTQGNDFIFVYKAGVRLIAEVIRRVEFVALSDGNKVKP